MPFQEEIASKVQSVLDFALHLQHVLDKDANVPSQTITDTSSYIQALPLPRKELSPQQRIEFDRIGVSLWNTCCKIGKSDGPQDLKSLATSAFRLFRHALKTSKSCLDAGLFDLGVRMVEHLAAKDEGLSEIQQENSPCEAMLSIALRAEYMLIRIALAWKQDRIELAHHFYTQLEAAELKTDPGVVRGLIDLCYEIGSDQLDHKQGHVAAKWLGRGCQLSDRYDAEIGDADALEMRLTLMHTLVRALRSSQHAEDGDDACRAMMKLKEEFGQKVCVIVLQLEIYKEDGSPDPEVFFQELLKLIRSVHLILSNHRLIMHNVHHMKSLSIRHAIEALMTYITTRLVVGEEYGWADNAIIALVWIVTASEPPSPSTIHDHTSCQFDKIQSAGRMSMGPEAAQSAFVLLWRRIEDSFNKDAKHDAVEWCHAAQHGLFSSGVQLENACKVERKIMRCYLDLSDVEAASKAWDAMSTPGREHFIGRYLYYCLALRRGDDAGVRSALNSLATVHDDRNRILFVAVSEALQYGTKTQTAQLLQRILDKYRENLPPEIDTYSLLRFTARLLISALSETNDAHEELHLRLCAVFKFVSTLSQNTSGEKSLPLQECRWFQKTAFNSAVQYHKYWAARYIIDMLQYSCEFALPAEIQASARLERLKHEVDAMALQAVLYVGEARSSSPSWTVEDIPKTSYISKSPPTQGAIKKLLYRNVFDRFSSMQRKMQEVPRDDSRTTETMAQKLISIAPLAFEAMLFMTGTDAAAASHQDLSLPGLLDQIIKLQPPRKTFSCLADMILSAACPYSVADDEAEDTPVQLPTSTVTQLLAKLIQGIRKQSSYDMSQASRWIRCVVQVVLDRYRDEFRTSDTEDDTGLTTVNTIVDQALGLARSAVLPPFSSSSSASSPSLHTTAQVLDHHEIYPTEELEWLATTLFNLSIDLYVSSGEAETGAESVDDLEKHNAGRESDGHLDGYRQPQFWARKAIEVADLLSVNARPKGDGGMLTRLLRERCQSIGWEV